MNSFGDSLNRILDERLNEKLIPKDLIDSYWIHNTCWNLVVKFAKPHREEYLSKVLTFSNALKHTDVDKIKRRKGEADQYVCDQRFVDEYNKSQWMSENDQ